MGAHSIARVWHLIRKDLWMQTPAMLLLFVLEVVSFVTFVAQFPPEMRAVSGVFLQGISAIGTFMIGYRILAAEESAGSLSFLKSLPLSTTEIFMSKFALIWLYLLFNSASLNASYLVMQRVSVWGLLDLQARDIVTGLAVQLFFATLLIWAATWWDAQKAIWIPFPLLIILLNVYSYALSPEQNDNWIMKTLNQLQDHWQLYIALAAVAALALSALVVLTLNHKRSLVQ